MVKNCDLGLENAALGLRPRAVFSRPRSQFFTIRTSQLANNIYILHGHCMTFSELSAVHELKWFRDLRGGGKHESRTRSSEREGFYLFTPEKYSQATLIRLKNV